MTDLHAMFGNTRRLWLRQRYWLRIALVFCLAWVLFVVLCIAVALAVGAYGEILPFFTPKGVLVVALFVLVFGAEGAILGGMADLLMHLAGKDAPERPSGEPRMPPGA